MLTAEEQQININKITDEVMAAQKRSLINKICRAVSTVCACLVVIVCLNIYTMNTLGEDLFSAAIKITQSGFSLDFSESGKETLPHGEDPATIPVTTTEQECSLSTTTATCNDYVGTTATADDSNSEEELTTTEIEVELLATTTVTAQESLPTTKAVTTEIYGLTTTATVCTEIPESPATTTEAIGTWAEYTTPQEETTTEQSCGSETTEVNVSEYIHDVCRKNGISVCGIYNPLMPSVSESNYEIDFTEYSTDLYFHFSGDNIKMDIIVEKYRNQKDIPEMLVPSTTLNYELIDIPCGTAFVFTENNLTTAVFSDGSTVYTLTGQCTDSDIKNIIETAAKGFIPYSQN
ncbi:MAG: hypothetical protein IKS03_08570, partial [Ruminococcus sp.]|nr:hypothetical protein [Ruminococcus sp.]